MVGAGPNGLVAANVLADAGWRVQVLEAQERPGGAVRSDRGVHPDYVNDLFSSFYPLAVASPALRGLELERWGLAWSHAPAVLAHPLPDGRCPVLWRDPMRTAASLESLGVGDGEAYLRLLDLWDRVGDVLLNALLTPFPPVRAGLRLLRNVHAAGGLRALRTLTLPARRMGEEEFSGPGGGLLLTGSGLHADFSPESPGSGAFGLLLVMLGQRLGWPVPVGGSNGITNALVRRLAARGGALRCRAPVAEVVVREGRCLGVRTADGEPVRARRAVLADVSAPALYGGLVDWAHLPDRLRGELRRFQWDFATFKTDWALSRPIPWAAEGAATAGTVHVADGLDHLTRNTADLVTGRTPERPCLVLGQMTTSDRSRSPAGTESAWAYTHLSQRSGQGGRDGGWSAARRADLADRMERAVERLAPGFRDSIVARRVLAPPDLQRLNRNLVRGALNGGTAAPHQQLVFRPTPGRSGPHTPVAGLYLASASAHPGGGVHGACGANAAHAALRSRFLPRRTRR
ncbi:NAD(P)/FAD-dependent oxidoreductase [Streptomyces sp. B6B3]|uniref:phytoene desaturase family protein n=1 Tax=Streptomyces sp. B6B3 TaxID=3153570 RepID=UPI00325DCF22